MAKDSAQIVKPAKKPAVKGVGMSRPKRKTANNAATVRFAPATPTKNSSVTTPKKATRKPKKMSTPNGVSASASQENGGKSPTPPAQQPTSTTNANDPAAVEKSRVGTKRVQNKANAVHATPPAKKIVCPVRGTPKKASVATAPGSHPTYAEMIKKAIAELKEHKGSSRAAISKHIVQHNQVGENIKLVNAHIRQALKRGVAGGTLKQVKGVGASGSFRIGEKATSSTAANNSPKKSSPKKVVVKASLKKVRDKQAASKPATTDASTSNAAISSTSPPAAKTRKVVVVKKKKKPATPKRIPFTKKKSKPATKVASPTAVQTASASPSPATSPKNNAAATSSKPKPKKATSGASTSIAKKTTVAKKKEGASKPASGGVVKKAISAAAAKSKLPPAKRSVRAAATTKKA